jgi:molecular chaperone DnaK (HSP70)
LGTIASENSVRLGIDFGTTRTVVAACDRGNYPVVNFVDQYGDAADFFPSTVAEKDGELRFGFEALAVLGEPGWTVRRSFKRMLGGSGASPDREVMVGGTRITLLELMTRFLIALRQAIPIRKKRSGNDEYVAVVATPANALGAQRFATLDAFRRAGFEVKAILNEPSAAGFEYTHRHRNTLNSKREHVIVYDLGGGTFDASLLRMSGPHHDVLATSGVSQLGGDDFDAVMALLVLGAAGLDRDRLPHAAFVKLLDQCRAIKEGLNPNSKRIVVDLQSCLGDLASVAEVTLKTADYYEACAPLVEETIEAMQPVITRLGSEESEALGEVAGIYVVGGASALPVVGRVLRERYGRRVHRSQYPSAAVAIGLALAADGDLGLELSDKLSRHFGVFREGNAGRDVVFDPIFHRDTPLPSQGSEVVFKRQYRPMHNLGRYRFVECSALDALGVPLGEMKAFDDVLFPFDAELRVVNDLTHVPVRRMMNEGPLIEEKYAVTSHGIVEVTITDLDSGYGQKFKVA